MTSRFKPALSLVLALITACSGGSPSGGDDDPMVDGGPRPDGTQTSTLDPNDCAGVAANFVQAAQTCGTQLPSNAQATFEAACRKGITKADLCGGDPAAGLACFETPSAGDFECVLGEPAPYCNNDLGAALGMYCLIALGNVQCASGVKCEYDSDCPSSSACNEATGECFAKEAYCVGLPCKYNADCPNGQKCNDAEGACILE